MNLYTNRNFESIMVFFEVASILFIVVYFCSGRESGCDAIITFFRETEGNCKVRQYKRAHTNQTV